MIALAAVLGALAVVVFETRDRMAWPLVARALERAAALEGSFGLRIGELRDEGWGTLVLGDVELVAFSDEVPLRRLSLRSGRVEFGARALLGQLDGLKAARLEGLLVDLDLEHRPGEPRAPRRPGEGPDLARAWPAVEVHGGRVILEVGPAGEWVWELSRAALAAPDGDGAQALELAGTTVEWRGTRRRSWSSSAELAGTWRGGELELAHLRLGELELIDAFEADLGGAARGKLAARLETSLFGLTGRFQLSGEGGALQLEAALAGLDPARIGAELARLELPYVPAELAEWPLPSGALQVEAELRLAEGEEPRLSGSLAGTDLDWAGRRLAEVDGRLSLVGTRLLLREFRAREGHNRLQAQDLALDLAAADTFGLLEGASGQVRLELESLPALIDPWSEQELWKDGVPAHRLRARARLESGRLRLTEGRFETDGGHVVLREGQAWLERGDIPVSGGDPRDHLHYQLRGDANFHSLAELTAILGQGEFAGSLSGALSLEGVDSRARARGELSGREVVAAGWALGDLETHVRLDEERVSVERLSARRPGEHLELSGHLRYRAAVKQATSAARAAPKPDLHLENVAISAHLGPTFGDIAARLDWGESRVERLEFEARIDGPLLEPRGRLDLAARNLEHRGQPVDALDLALTANGAHLVIESLTASSPAGRLRVAGEFDAREAPGALDVALGTFEAEALGDRLVLERPAALRWREGHIEVEPWLLRGSAGSLELRAEGPREAVELVLRAEELDLAPFLARLLPEPFELGALDLQGRVTLDGAGWPVRGELSGTLGDTRPGPEWPVLRAELRAHLAEERLRFESLSLAGRDGERAQVSGELPWLRADELFAPGPVDLTLRAEAPRIEHWIPKAPAHGRFELEGRLGGSWRALEGDLRLAGAELGFQDEQSALGQLGRARLALVARLGAGRGLELSKLELVADDRARFELAGSLELEPNLPALLDRTPEELLESPLTLAGRGELVDLAWLRPLFDGVRSLGGRLDLESLRIEGPVGSPRPRAEVTLTEASIRLEADIPTLSELTGRLRLDGDEFTIEELRGMAGGAPMAVTGKLAPLAEEPWLDLGVSGENLLLFRTSDVNLRADANLRVHGPVERLRVEGEVDLTAGRFTRDINFLSFGRGRRLPAGQRGITLFSLREPPLSNLRFDVRVRSREPFRIDNNMVRGGLSPDLRLTGTGEVPVLEGPIYLRPTRVRLPATILRFTGGTILFERENPFVPQLELNAETRMRGFDISVQVTGPYDDPDVVMTSIPPMPPQDVVVLVATGQLPETALTTQGGAQTAQLVALYLAQDLSSQFFGGGRDDDSESFLERFEVTAGRDVSRTGQETIEGSFRLFEDLIRRKDRGLITVERDIYDEYNFGLRLVLRRR